MGNKSAKYNVDNAAEANLQHGDIVKISRNTSSGVRAFYHFAVYVGEGYIIHLTKSKKRDYCKCSDDRTYSDNNTDFVCTECKKEYRFVVKSEPLVTALEQSEFVIANNRDGKIRPRDDTVVRAACQLGPARYSVCRYNCEHFVNWCRYNSPISKQSLIKWFNVGKYEKKVKGTFKKLGNKIRGDPQHPEVTPQ